MVVIAGPILPQWSEESSPRGRILLPRRSERRGERPEGVPPSMVGGYLTVPPSKVGHLPRVVAGSRGNSSLGGRTILARGSNATREASEEILPQWSEL
jgi:hypothetical protein